MSALRILGTSTCAIESSRYSSRTACITRRLAGLLGCALLFFLSGCAHLTRFSNTAADFNVQVADAQNKTMLLNIVRAANRFPMHFTELTTLTGTGTLTTGGTLTLPFATLNGGTSTFSAAPTVSISETPTFNAAVLETQEFYKGVLAPLKLDQISNYVNEGVPPQTMYTLLFGRLMYQTAPAKEPVFIENNFHPLKKEAAGLCPTASVGSGGKTLLDNSDHALPLHGSEHECFKDVLNALMERHLSIEQITEVNDVGTLLDERSFNDAELIDELQSQDLKVVPVTSADCSKTTRTPVCPQTLSKDSEKKLNDGAVLYRLQKEEKSYRFCFDVDPPPNPKLATNPTPAAKPTPQSLPLPSTLGEKIRGAEIQPDSICHARITTSAQAEPARSLPKGAPKGTTVSLTYEGMKFTVELKARSTEGLIYYLGEIARCDLGLDAGAKCSPVNVVTYEGQCDARLFQVHQAGEEPAKVPCPRDSIAGLGIRITEKVIPIPSGTESQITATWGKRTYWVNIDPSATDRSGAVLRILAQLLALNRSAKDLPAPAVVPLISH